MSSTPQTVHRYTGTVREIRFVTPTVFHLVFEADQGFTFKAGQFLSVIVPVSAEKNLRRAYSIASAPEDTTHHLCVKLVDTGPGTNYLTGLKPGESFSFMAPYGHFIFRPGTGRTAVFVSTGTGISPFHSIAFSKGFLDQPPPRSICLFGARSEDELLYADRFQTSTIEWVPCLSRPTGNWSGYRGRVTDFLRHQISHDASFDFKAADFYLCGNGEMIREAKQLLFERGVEKAQIFQEAYF